MNIAIIGYGKMGKEIEAQAGLKNHQITLKIDTAKELKAADFSNTEVAIDFTTPDVVMDNINVLAQNGVNIVVGTTGWYNHVDEVKKIVADNKIGFLWSANFSIGVNIYWQILQQAAKLIDKFEDYDVFGHEFHHNQKKDSPSGTAIKTAQILINNIKRKNTMVTEKLDRAPLENELHFSSTRGGKVPGTHSVFFDSAADTIEITHTARGRAGFALGAIQAAEWLQGKKGYFTMDDFIDDISK
jgi:4-hydroxy-tetrahydrodipicolinate reductase